MHIYLFAVLFCTHSFPMLVGKELLVCQKCPLYSTSLKAFVRSFLGCVWWYVVIWFHMFHQIEFDIQVICHCHGSHIVDIMDDYSKQECLVSTPIMISLKQKYFSEIPYPRYQLTRSSGPMMVASCWSEQKEDICPSIKKSLLYASIFWVMCAQKIWAS